MAPLASMPENFPGSSIVGQQMEMVAQLMIAYPRQDGPRQQDGPHQQDPPPPCPRLLPWPPDPRLTWQPEGGAPAEPQEEP